jgi:GNAT superfamily N-acetyltransferase
MGERAAYICLEAGEADLGELARLRTDWTVAQGGSADERFEDDFRRWWTSHGAHRRAWLARPDLDGADLAPVVGMVNAAVFERMPRPGRPAGRWAYVANVWVDPDHRRRGVGSLLMASALEWCREERMDRVVLNPSAMSVPMYRALGFRPADDLLRLDL